MRYPEQAYIDFDPCFGDEEVFSRRKVTIVKARKDHPCFLGINPISGEKGHTIKAGDHYRHERALAEGRLWVQYRVCVPCMDTFLDQVKGIPTSSCGGPAP